MKNKIYKGDLLEQWRKYTKATNEWLECDGYLMECDLIILDMVNKDAF